MVFIYSIFRPLFTNVLSYYTQDAWYCISRNTIQVSIRNERIYYERNVNTWNIQYGYILAHFLSHVSLFGVMRCSCFSTYDSYPWRCSCNLTETLGHFWLHSRDTSLKILYQSSQTSNQVWKENKDIFWIAKT